MTEKELLDAFVEATTANMQDIAREACNKCSVEELILVLTAMNEANPQTDVAKLIYMTSGAYITEVLENKLRQEQSCN